MWLACYTQQEIADVVGLTQPQVKEKTDGFIDIGNLAKSDKSAAEHATSFTPPIYNICQFSLAQPIHDGRQHRQQCRPPLCRIYGCLCRFKFRRSAGVSGSN